MTRQRLTNPKIFVPAGFSETGKLGRCYQGDPLREAHRMLRRGADRLTRKG